MQISNAKVVTLTYQLTVTDKDGVKDLIETVDAEQPMVFIHGMSGLPEAFEDKILGLSADESFDFSISAEEGYGEYDPQAIVDLPKEIFMVDGAYDEQMLQVGNVLPMTDDQGNRLQGIIVEVQEAIVRMDFNHPLSDKEMAFTGVVLSVREATETELAHGHVHGVGGVQH